MSITIDNPNGLLFPFIGTVSMLDPTEVGLVAQSTAEPTLHIEHGGWAVYMATVDLKWAYVAWKDDVHVVGKLAITHIGEDLTPVYKGTLIGHVMNSINQTLNTLPNQGDNQ